MALKYPLLAVSLGHFAQRGFEPVRLAASCSVKQHQRRTPYRIAAADYSLAVSKKKKISRHLLQTLPALRSTEEKPLHCPAWNTGEQT